MFDFLKKDKGDAPPDVGQEDEFEEEQKREKPKILKKKSKASLKKKTVEPSEEDEEESVEIPKVSKSSSKVLGGGVSKLEVDRLNARVEALQSLLKSFNERFSVIGQQIGEVRAMNLSTEKAISRSKIESEKASDIVREVKPDKLRLDYQKLDMKMATLAEKIEANNQYAKTVMNEVKDLKHKAGVFLGTDALLQLNEDVKKDLIELQKLSSRVRVNADKSEQLFIELREGFADSQKLSAMVANLDNFASDLKEEIDKLKLDHSEVIKQKEFGDFKKNVNNKFLGVDSSVEEVERIKKENERLGRVIENIFSVVKRNQDDIGTIGLSLGKSGVKKVDDYDNKILELLRVMEKMANELKEMKKKKNLKVKGVKKLKEAEKKISKKKIKEVGEESEPSEEVEEKKVEDIEGVENPLEEKKEIESVDEKLKSLENVDDSESAEEKSPKEESIEEDISREENVKEEDVEEKTIKPNKIKNIGKNRKIRSLDEIKKSSEKSAIEPEPSRISGFFKKFIKPKKEIEKEEVEMENIENELKDIRNNLSEEIKKPSLDDEIIEKKIVKKDKERVKKKVVKEDGKFGIASKKKDLKNKLDVKKLKIKKEMPEKRKLSKKEKLKQLRIRNLKKARDAKRRLKEIRLKNLKKARVVRMKNLKK